jgi:hypothetical protein
MIKCSECGYENMDGLDYCDGCGAKLAAGDASAASAAPEAPAPATPTPAAPTPAAAAPEQPPAEAAPAEEAKASEVPTGEIKAEPAPAPATPAPAPAVMAAFKAKLTIVRGSDRKNHEFPLEDGNNLIGRWDPETGAFPEVDLDADDPEAKISRKHALIRIVDGKITVEDVGSLNGTYVNRGARLVPGSPIDLKTGDEIIIGKTFLKLTIDPIS